MKVLPFATTFFYNFIAEVFVILIIIVVVLLVRFLYIAVAIIYFKFIVIWIAKKPSEAL